MKKIVIFLLFGWVHAGLAMYTDDDVRQRVERQDWRKVSDGVQAGHISPEQLCRYDKAQLDATNDNNYTLFQGLIWCLDYHQFHIKNENEMKRISECLKTLIKENKVTHNIQLIDNRLTTDVAARCRPLYANILQSINDERERSTPPVTLHKRSHVLWYLAGGAAVVAFAVGVWKYYSSPKNNNEENNENESKTIQEVR